MEYHVARPYIDTSDINGVVRVLKSGILSLGLKHKEFERQIATYTQAPYACSVSNGTCGLHLAVRALGLKENDEVITSPFSFIASSNCLLYEHVKPVFVDIEDHTYNMDPSKIEKTITSKTKAILVVHIFGQSADMDEIMRIAKKYNLMVIEDACESLGSTHRKKATGTFGDVGVYAFYPNKQMTTGEGGIIVTRSKRIYDLCASMRNQGRNFHGDWLIHERIGYNYRMDEMSASLGVTQLKKIDWMIEEKRKIARWYFECLSPLFPEVIVPQVGDHRTHSWFVYVVRFTKRGLRNVLMKKLEAVGIQTKPYLPVIHLQPFMRKMFGYKKGDFPMAETIASQTLALPFYIGLKKSDIQTICDEVRKYL